MCIIIIHNSISLDGSLTGFMPDMELHYRIAGTYKPDAHLIGSETIIKGNEMFGNGIPEEESSDLIQPHRDPDLPWWIIVDSGGRLKGMLHTCRRFEYCRDIIILISESTPQDYKEYLNERDYSYITTGKEKIDIMHCWDELGIPASILGKASGIKVVQEFASSPPILNRDMSTVIYYANKIK